MLVAYASISRPNWYPVKFSIIIPSFNQGRFIRRTIDSILLQGYADTQIIVSDGGSNDGTVEILRRYGDRLIWWSKPDKGYADAVNQCLPLVTGDIIAIQSSDDYYLPGAFRVVEESFRRHPKCGIISGGFVSIDLDEKIWSLSSQSGPVDPMSHLMDFLPQHATFIKKETLCILGGVRAEVDMCADIDLWYRALHHCRGRRIAQLLAVYQLHPAQRTARSDKWASSLVRMVGYAEGTLPYSKLFKVETMRRQELFEYWRIFWAHSINDPKATALARDAVAKGMSNYSLKTKSIILYIACRPLGSRLSKLNYYFQNGCSHVAIWSFFNTGIIRGRQAFLTRGINLRWAGVVQPLCE